MDTLVANQSSTLPATLGGTAYPIITSAAGSPISSPAAAGYTDALTLKVTKQGLYVVAAGICVTTNATTGGGTYTIRPVLTFTNVKNEAITRVAMPTIGSVSAIDALTAVASGLNYIGAIGSCLAKVGTDITLEVHHNIQNDDAAAGKYDVVFSISLAS